MIQATRTMHLDFRADNPVKVVQHENAWLIPARDVNIAFKQRLEYCNSLIRELGEVYINMI